MIAYTKARVVRVLKIEFVRFCIVGGSGFLINLAILTILRQSFGAPIYVAQFVAAEIGLFSNFMLHNHWTYKSHHIDKSTAKLIIQFHATSWPAVVGTTLMVTLGVKIFHLRDVVALVIAAVVALAWSFIWSKYVVWRDVSPLDVERLAERL